MEWEGAIEFVRDNAWLVAGVAIIANLSLLAGCFLSMSTPSDKEQLQDFKQKLAKGD
eukprot:m.22877 g.22877  ORF g.22877 m.22877 type:complete len:57 (-) comp4037_c0_seq1:1744-1914(-)